MRRASLRRVLRALLLLILLAGLGLGSVLLPLSRGELPALPAAEELATPFADARFRAACTAALHGRLDGHAAWPLRRVAGLCLCLADRIRDGRQREVGALAEGGVAAMRGEAAALLGTVEARLCRAG